MTRPVPLTPIDWRYPDEARANNPRGLIMLKCVIDVQGVIEDCEILRSLPGVTDWAIRKLKAAQFRPVTLDGPGAEGMVICRITVEGRARECQGSAGPISDWFIAQMLEAKFLPASFEGTPFETEHAVRYSFGNRRRP